MSSSTKHDDKNDNIKKKKSIKQLEEDIVQLTQTIDSIEEVKISLQSQLQKVLADYRNLEKNMEDRVRRSINREKTTLLSSFIEIMDDIKFGMKAGEKLGLKGDEEAWFRGIIDTLSKMENVLSSVGVKIIEVKVGDIFDPRLHEAIAVISVKAADSAVIEVAQQGYMLDDFVIRPARVVINKSEK